MKRKSKKMMYCSVCGAKGLLKTFHKRADGGSYICWHCIRYIPIELLDLVSNGSMDQVRLALAYAERSRREFEPIFRADIHMGILSIDEENLLFKFSDSKLIFRLCDVTSYEFNFGPNETKVDSDQLTLKASVTLDLETVNPCISYWGKEIDTARVTLEDHWGEKRYSTPEFVEEYAEKFGELCRTARASGAKLGRYSAEV